MTKRVILAIVLTFVFTFLGTYIAAEQGRLPWIRPILTEQEAIGIVNSYLSGTTITLNSTVQLSRLFDTHDMKARYSNGRWIVSGKDSAFTFFVDDKTGKILLAPPVPSQPGSKIPMAPSAGQQTQLPTRTIRPITPEPSLTRSATPRPLVQQPAYFPTPEPFKLRTVTPEPIAPVTTPTPIPRYSFRKFYLDQAEHYQRLASSALENANYALRQTQPGGLSQPGSGMYKYYIDQYQSKMKEYANYQKQMNEYLIKAQREP